MQRADFLVEAVGERFHHFARKTRQDPVGQSRHRVLLVDEQRHAHQPGRNPAGAGGIAAHPQHQTRAHRLQHLHRFTQRRDQHEGRQQPAERAFAAQTADGERVQPEAFSGNHSRFEPLVGAEPFHIDAPGAQTFGDFQRRVNVPAGAARGNQNRDAVCGAAHGPVLSS